ncbi:MAG: peptidase [Bacteroidia bacterium]|nr:peptidase [Bacteroidia bacterium]
MKNRSNLLTSILITSVALLLMRCGGKQDNHMMESEQLKLVRERIAMFAETEVSADLSALTERERACVLKLVQAGKLADAIFWMQSSHDAAAVRDSLATRDDDAAKDFLTYVMIHYGPYDRIFEGERFVGHGPERKPLGAGLYPPDMSREEFESWVAAHPEQRAALESPYTIIVRGDDGLRAVPYHTCYPQVHEMSRLLLEASELADNPGLRKYLALRAKAVITDEYYDSDMAWMDLKTNNIDVVIGPIENYEDGLFNYKTAYECAVMVKDPEGTRELQMFISHIDAFEKALPIESKYTRTSAGSGNILEVVNIVYFGGDFHAGVKTIAASLPNDPRVTEKKGGKKQMYKNLMEAKFDKIVVPIAERILDPALHPFVNRSSFTSFVTLHEVSHTLGMPYVYGKPELSVRRALKDRYSAIEECKADVLGLYNNMVLLDEKIITKEALKKSIVTYVAGLFRSLRFGAEEAHGKANLIQLNWLIDREAVIRSGKRWSINFDRFMPALTELAREVLMLEILGNYDGAGEMLTRYGGITPAIQETVAALAEIPRDLNTKYSVLR